MNITTLRLTRHLLVPAVLLGFAACGPESSGPEAADGQSEITPSTQSTNSSEDTPPIVEAFVVPAPTDGDDEIVGDRSDNVIRGALGNDTLIGKEGNDQLDGGPGNDVLIGGRGDDVLIGRAGSDVFRGGAGNDTMTGAFNGDKYFFAGDFGNDVITDFEANNINEKLNFVAVDTIESLEDLLVNHASQDGDSVVISDGNGNSVTLEGVLLSDLDESNLVF